ncbi:reductase [Leifsonia sp. LS1]|uniref:NAD-dependent epimerase/dehydratase family protein n=1 Tax=Leifsonia sp. LS1 TaxID=2828483 RepID=UPI001CFD0566|nr:NAD-dependent epimerase/dehydratase family protein [Leifsonia sp. LS1]GIT82135.1 reductase [Leifsonia sp. LS1]
MPSALILGGTGLLGRATALRLANHGWEVAVTGRDPRRMPAELAEAGVEHRASDRRDPDALAAAVGEGVDLLVDALCFTAEDARSLLPHLGGVGSTVMFSSKAVYVDGEGRHINSPERPNFGGPVAEGQATLEPAWDGRYRSREGYGRNKVAAERVLLDSGYPATVLRASKVHGVGAALPREWHFVRRVLDGRPAVLLAHGGRGFDHPTAAVNAAALVEAVAGLPGSRILNTADPDIPTGLDIARLVARTLGHAWEEVPVEAAEPGWHPWDVVPGIRLDLSAATALGYRPEGDYAVTVRPAIEWAASFGPTPPWAAEVEESDFDYAAEDAYLAGR